MKVSVVIPTFNEAENILPLVARLGEALEGEEYELVIVDDNSPDGTAERARALKDAHVKVVQREKKDGLASAVVEGFKHCSGKFIVVMDADLQHPPEVAPRLIAPLVKGGAEIVIASRYVPEGGVEEKWSFLRRIVSRGSAHFARFLVPQLRGIRDPLSGFFAVDAKILENARLNPIGFKILAEILVKVKYQRVCEVPFVFATRKFGESNLNLKEEINFVRHNFHLRFYSEKR